MKKVGTGYRVNKDGKRVNSLVNAIEKQIKAFLLELQRNVIIFNLENFFYEKRLEDKFIYDDISVRIDIKDIRNFSFSINAINRSNLVMPALIDIVFEDGKYTKCRLIDGSNGKTIYDLENNIGVIDYIEHFQDLDRIRPFISNMNSILDATIAIIVEIISVCNLLDQTMMRNFNYLEFEDREIILNHIHHILDKYVEKEL